MKEHDIIHLRRLTFFGHHGVMPEENVLGQKFIVDVDLYLNLRKPGLSDQVEDTINYAEVYEKIKAVVTGERYSLLERLAQRIADQILEGFLCDSVRVEVHKPEAPIPGIFEDVSVEIWREKQK
ncbi:dihydroneopterin aldolase [Desulfitobacterium sp. AusDCA]|uniref:dihydroneopterin aldolase n=1 Tax=Desulfitobacterium sp. AusDCA TaxID=3240383 RepID=UPI003DA7079E